MTGFLKQLSDNVKQEIAGLFLLALAVLSYLALAAAPAGVFGSLAVRLVYSLFGQMAGFFPWLLAVAGLATMTRWQKKLTPPKIVGLGLLIIIGMSAYHLAVPAGQELAAGFRGQGGGLVGAFTLWFCRKVFGLSGATVVLVTLGITGALLLTGISLVSSGDALWIRLVTFLRGVKDELYGFIFPLTGTAPTDTGRPNRREHSPVPKEPELEYIWREEGDEPSTPERPGLVTGQPSGETGTVRQSLPGTGRKAADKAVSVVMVPTSPLERAYRLPPFSVLRGLRVVRGKGRPEEGDRSQLLEDTLASFGVQAKVVDVTRGPAVTRYELQPAPGVKVSKVLSLADDIALSLAAMDVRIEAPIPGKAAIGIEVPNAEVAIVPLREVLENSEFTEARSKLTVALGKDIAGTTILSDLGKMVHVLVAGSTGSGKSVCINTIIASILFKAKPDEVKFLMVDPKVVELTNYNGIPHLIAPVVTDPRKAAGALRWVVQEMENRYSLFASAGVRDILKYNQLAQVEPRESQADETPAKMTPLPFIVVIIDELADLMMVAAVDVEDAICRLAQMARAAGIHLVVATQRPSVDVVTGLIKANIPSRISFAVSAQVDSRTILDMNGAEKLLGKGDMLYFPTGASKPLRVQGAFVSDKEVETLVEFWKGQAKPEYEQGVVFAEDLEKETAGHEDELFERAVELILQSNQASISLLQRRMHIGYTRAGRLIDMMEEQGIVGRHEGSKAREILVTLDQWRRLSRQ
jgi:DNA segregation ATPase FtsK/SpoIIIE, S-DNA-T family